MSNYSIKLRQERREELALRALALATNTDNEQIDSDEEEVSELTSSYTYEVELDDTEFGSLPPFMKVGMIKNLKKKLDAESDPDKKAEIQAKIDKLNGDKKEEMATKVASILEPHKHVI